MAVLEISNETLSQVLHLLQQQLNNQQQRDCHLFAEISNISSNSKRILLNNHENQIQAVLYISVVLLFYSGTLGTLLIKYMRKEERTAHDEQCYQDFLTKTKQLALQQQKLDYARRVSLQLMHLTHLEKMKYPDRLGRMTTLKEITEMESAGSAGGKNNRIQPNRARCADPDWWQELGMLKMIDDEDEEDTKVSVIEKTEITRITVV